MKVELGTLLRADEGARDAVHVAILPVTAGEDLLSGDIVGIDENGLATKSAYPIGIVDPYLIQHSHPEGVRYPVRAKTRFYLCLFPGEVTGMRHHWEHAVVDSKQPLSPEKQAALHAIHKFAEKWSFTPDELISEAARPGGYVVRRGHDMCSASELDGDDVSFWRNLEILLDREFDHDHRSNIIWSCSC